MAAVGGDRVLIGATGDDVTATNSGAAYLFSTNGVLLKMFTNPNPAYTASAGFWYYAGDQFGLPVAVVSRNGVSVPHEWDIADYTHHSCAEL